MKKILLLVLLPLFLYSVNVRTYIPKNARIYLPVLYATIDKIYPEFILPPYFASLIEQESCIHLKHSRCWNPRSELKTRREQGVGFGQITRAWRRNGTLRFDTLRNLKRRYPKYLKDLTWKNMKRRPDLQIAAMILLWKGNYRRLPDKIDDYNKLCFATSAYNGGYGAVIKDRRYCGLKKGCNPNIWFGNVEKNSLKSRRKLYGNRSAYDINRQHARMIMKVRLFKYIDDYYNKNNSYKGKKIYK
jgi:hypothetical protein